MELGSSYCFVVLISIVLVSNNIVSSQILTPPYFNLAEGSSISASATCGEDIVTSKERFCRLTGASADERQEILSSSLYYTGYSQIIAGQLCDDCFSQDNPSASPSNVHSAKFAVDGTERWWQSPPLSRGPDYNNVNLTIDLGQEFHVAYVFIKMGNSPRPGIWSLERSTDYGATWQPWQHFADSPADCMLSFSMEATSKPKSDNDVICTTEFSKIVPLEGGEIAVSLVQDRPGSTNFSYSTELQEFTKATNVRLNLLRTKTLFGHLMLVQRQDPTVTRRYFYSVKDISIGGRCVCNGHADACDKKDQFKLVCDCQHNTCGDQCDRCCEPFVQKKWRKATETSENACEPCQCYNHTDECIYDEEVDRLGLSIDINGKYEGGGVCQNCRDNTAGTNCDKCIPGYYRPRGRSLYDKNVCEPCVCDPNFTTGSCADETGICECKEQYTGPNCRECAFGYYDPPVCRPCDCFLNGTIGEVCEVGGGQCPCKENYMGLMCDQCADGYYNFPECTPCVCTGEGLDGRPCDKATGQCSCEYAYAGIQCDKCEVGFFSYPTCSLCDCDTTGTTAEVCDVNSGQCICKDNYTGTRCDKCAPGYYSYPECKSCDCDTTGTLDGSNECNDLGQCKCLLNFGGKKCSECAPGFHNYPTCKSCDCSVKGSRGVSCDQSSAQCDCRPNFTGLKCSSCAPDFYNFPTCEACLCNPAGAIPVPGYPLGGCGSFDDGQTLCECKSNVEGHICDRCKPGYFDLTRENSQGCKPCMCHLPGTLLGDNMCDPVTGQCLCKVNVNSEYCQACIPGTYNLQESSVFGCQDCDCDMGGAISRICDDVSGQCTCRPRITGRACNKPIESHYFPELHQLKYEMEEGFNPTEDDAAVRFEFDPVAFPDFSWRGYAVFGRIQPEVRVNVTVDKPSLFRLIFRFTNPNYETVKAKLVLTPEDPSEPEQSTDINFPSTGSSGPEFLTTDEPFVLNRGKWTVALKIEGALNVDYLVLLPQAYYEAGVLQDELKNPCMVPDDKQECLHYTYVDVNKFNRVDGGDAERPDNASVDLVTNRDILMPLNYPKLAELNSQQPELVFNVTLKEPGKHVFVIDYISSTNVKKEMKVSLQPDGDNATEAKVVFYACEYSSLCRQVVIDMDGGQQILDSPTINVKVTISADDATDASIGSVTAIPKSAWKDEILKPEVMCIQVNGVCTESSYTLLPDSIKVEAETKANITDMYPAGVDTNKGLVKLDAENTVLVPFKDLRSQSYAIFVNYYQPEDLGAHVGISVDVNGVMYSGYFDASYCPNTAGCQGLIIFDDILIQNDILEVLSPEATINIKPLDNEDTNVWVDYIQMVPTRDTSKLKRMFDSLKPYDHSGNYLANCVGSDYYIDPEKGQISPFCRSTIFSVTTEYNNGALPCECDAQGSESFRCSEFGGQCRCKPNVIGRKCDACAQNYYGFPDCKPCNCPATCNAITGACECPKHVIGDNCDQCAPQTFAYDRTIGCMPCKCNSEGVLNSNLNCNLDTGACDCKPNVDGRKCDFCMDGFWNFPQCQACDCDATGTTQSICDKDTSKCLCKVNAGGSTCGVCEPGTFNLESRNPLGCTKCFCFGITSTCMSSSLLQSEIMNMTGWGLTNVNGSADVVINGDTVTANIENSTAMVGSTMYWSAPIGYLGNRLTSYGGQIKYTVGNFGAGRGDLPKKSRVPGADVKISGKGMTVTYSLLSPILEQEINIDIIETLWRHDITGAPVTREQFMTVLVAVDSILIKANYYEDIPEALISTVSLDSAVELEPTLDGNNTAGVSRSLTSDIALSVESCQCPPNYKGLSCEDCADGFYRKLNELGQFVCVPCECNGHSNMCDGETGVCSECQGNTVGDHCERCRQGYTGDPTVEDCIICACPMPIESNNFAETCTLSPFDANTIQCDCLPGYLPPFCDVCGPGHYGDPRNLTGGVCQPCECNGNIDPSNPQSCDNFDGNCRVCLNNTQGNSCQECEDFYWGDAIDAKNCQECDCDRLGTDSCDKATGQCICKPNAIGDRCDQCTPDTWGFSLGNGCTSCNCSIASTDTQCNNYTGVCDCQPGVTGRHCSSCLPQHWDFSTSGCKPCECEMDGAVGCNVETGICKCLQGVTGDKCDRCENRWVLIADKGCEPCDNCVHTLLDETDVMKVDITNASSSLHIINIGVEAMKRLDELNQTATMLKSRLGTMPRRSLDPAEMKSLTDMLAKVKDLADEAVGEAETVENMASDTAMSYENLITKLNKTKDSKDDISSQLEDILEFIENKYQDVINSAQLVNADRLLKEANTMIANMRSRQTELDARVNDSSAVLDEANATMQLVQGWNNRNMNLTSRFDAISTSLNDTNSRLADLLDNANEALSKSAETETMLVNVKKMIEDLQKNTESIKLKQDEIEKMLANAVTHANTAEGYVANATNAYQELEEKLTILEKMVEELNTFFDKLVVGNQNVKPSVESAMEHANKLREQADNLNSLLADTNEASDAAYKAANAYVKIVESINRALNASNKALEDANEAIQQSRDIHNNTEQVRAKSEQLLMDAEKAKNETSSDLRSRLENSKKTIKGLEENIANIEQKHDEVQFNINNIKDDNEENAKAARELAAKSKKKAEEALQSVKPINDTLSDDLVSVDKIPLLQDQMNLKLVQIRSKMETIKANLPDALSLTENLKSKTPDLTAARQSLNISINALKSKIESARAIANRIKVAMKSEENTTVELRAPDDLVDKLQQSAELNLFFQTEEKDGLLLYIGPKATSNMVEYLALELEDGKVVWKYNLGDNVAEIRSGNSNYNDGRWHQVIATRTGKEGMLAVRTHEEKEDQITGTTGGRFNQLDLTPQATKIYAAGVPDNFALPPTVRNRRFVGGLDDISYSENQIQLGLWNFVSGQNNDEGILDRGDELIEESSDSVRFRSSAGSYITINKGSLSAAKTLLVSLTFRTLNKDGLLFFIGQDLNSGVQKPDYFKLYLKDGKVHAAIELGGGEILNVLENKYVSDGEEHNIRVIRSLHEMTLLVDSQKNKVIGSEASKQLNLGANPELHLGGIPKSSKYYGMDVVDHPYYDGCLSDLVLNQNKKSIAVNYEAKVGTVSGCKLVKRTVTFLKTPVDQTEPGEGFVQIIKDVVSVSENFTVGMRVKTLASDGLLFYSSNEEDTHAFSIALTDGRVKVVNTAGHDNKNRAKRNNVETKRSFNDGRWHHISVIKQGITLRVIVDDNFETTNQADHRGRKTKTVDTFGYFIGGLRPELVESIADKDNSASWERFVGCISDVIIENILVDFAESRPSGPNADYSACPVPDPIDPEASTLSAGQLVMDATTIVPKRCVLPVEPDVKNVREQGTRFGLAEDSRFEFRTFGGLQSNIQKEIRLNNNIKLTVKTYATEGMIWFVGSTKDPEFPDYSTLYLEEGKVVYQVNLGSGSVTGRSNLSVNDGEWHIIEFKRQRKSGVVTGQLIIDEGKPILINWPDGGATALNIQLPIYIGGLDKTDIRYKYMAQKIGPSSAASLVGCIDKIQYHSKDPSHEWIDYGTETKAVSTQACFENQEDGAFIPASGGSLAVGNQIKLGANNEVEVSVRPRSLSGVILMIWGGGDYIGIELVQGRVKVNVDNGAGDIEVGADVPNICDGQWRTIKVIKSKNVVKLEIQLAEDNTMGAIKSESSGSTSSTSADTSSPIYIGGIPEEASGSRYKPASGTDGYIGCIRGVKVSNQNHNLSRARKIGDVALTCPTT